MIGGVKQGRVHVKNWVWVHFKAGQNILSVRYFILFVSVNVKCFMPFVALPILFG
jgi:hypothetical protein